MASTSDQDDDQEPDDGGADYNLSVSEICLARWLVEEDVFILCQFSFFVCPTNLSCSWQKSQSALSITGVPLFRIADKFALQDGSSKRTSSYLPVQLLVCVAR